MNAIPAMTVSAAPSPPAARSVLALNSTGPREAELLVYGPIGDDFWGEGITAAGVAADLAALDVDTLNVRINSDGGQVSDGLAMFNALSGHRARVNVTIDGVAASIASLIAQAGSTRRVYRNALMMIHGPRTGQWGFARELRDTADHLDTFAAAMQSAYSARASDPEQIRGWLGDCRDHWLTAEEMVAAGLADDIIDPLPAPAADAASAAAALLSCVQALASAPDAAIRALLQRNLQHTVTASAFARLTPSGQQAVFSHLEDSPMKQHCQSILAQAGTPVAAADTAPPLAAVPPAPPAAAAPPAPPAPSPVAADAAAAPDDPVTALAARNDRLRSVFAAFHDVPGVRELEAACLADPRMSVEQAQARLLQRLPNGAAPLAANAGGGHVESVRDETDTARARIVDGILARAGLLSGAEATAARQDNPAAAQPLIVLAEHSLARAGVNARNMDRTQIARQVLATQTTSDFPVLLESVLHKMLLGAYTLQPMSWRRICTTGTLSDYRPHHRYHTGSFSDLKQVNEAGEYETGVLSDGARETIQAVRKGRILQLTPEILVNDDLNAFTRPTALMGQAAARTIEKDVYALFTLNGGAGPLMGDGKPLFHTDHKNIAATGSAPSIASIDAVRQAMAQQMDTGGLDYLDISPSLFLGPLSLGSSARELNAQEYNDEATRHQRKPNVVRGLFSDIIDTVRLSGNAWYMLAAPAIEPVFEVAFLDGIQTPQLEQETNFRTDGLSWKVVLRYGVAAIGWRGIYRNPGV